MNDFLKDLLFAVVTAAIPVLTAYLIGLIRKLGDKLAAQAVSVEAKTYIDEITTAVISAVASTNQTYVDSLKSSNAFSKESQEAAAQMALNACIAAISPAAQSFIEEVYGDVTSYLTTRIEAEVRTQKS